MMKMLIRSVLCIFLACISLSSPPLFAEPTAQFETVNINTADAATLSKALKGIGEHKAEAIVEYRQKVGDFKAIEELTEIKGIGLKLIEANRNRIVLE